MKLAGYEHLLRAAARLQWDEREIDLAPDAAAWPTLDATNRDAVTRFVAGFALAETAVAEEIGPFADAAGDELLARAFRAQEVDEQRHARFFERVTREVIGANDLRGHVDPRFADLFEGRLRAVARDVREHATDVHEAVLLYHLVLEGLVFNGGQHALLERLASLPLPGVRRGAELVARDERWHVGLGVRVLQERGLTPEAARALEAEAAPALATWGDLLTPVQVDQLISLHMRRLRAARLEREMYPAVHHAGP